MPYPSQTSRETIITTAWKLIEQTGVEGMSLANLAAELGIKAPSLYRHVPSRAHLIRAVNEETFRRLFQTYDDAARASEGAGPREQLLAIFRAHRRFAHQYPATYVLAFTTTVNDQRADARWLEQTALSIQAIMARLTGMGHSLAALRGALALVHGFVFLELHAQFQRGGDLDAAFEESISAYLEGWAV